MFSFPSLELLYAFHSITFVITGMAALSLFKCLISQKKIEHDLEKAQQSLELERIACGSKMKDLMELYSQVRRASDQ